MKMNRKFSDLAYGENKFSDQALIAAAASPLVLLRNTSSLFDIGKGINLYNGRPRAIPGIKDLFYRDLYSKMVSSNKGVISYANMISSGLYMAFENSVNIVWNSINSYNSPLYNPNDRYCRNVTIDRLVEGDITW